MADKSVALRLKELRGRADISLREMARRLGMPPSSYSHYENPDRFKSKYLPMDLARQIAREIADPQIKSEIIGLAGGNDDDLVAAVPNGAPAPKGAQLVAVYDVCASAGFGMLAPEYEAVAYNLAFPPDYLRRITSTHPEKLAIVSVKGDSMSPTLNDGDIVLVDTTKTSLAYEGIFVIRIDDALQVKRISHSRPGHVFVVSDNADHYPRREHPREEVTVIGKVLWAGGKVS